MDRIHTARVGDRGRLVIPAELRESAVLDAGATVTLVETDHGITMLTRDQLRDLVRRDLAGLDLVADLLADRRRSTAADDV